MMTSSGEGLLGDSYMDGNKSSISNHLPKFGVLIPNRIFVGSIAGNTTEAELKQFFSTYGEVKDCKIILDKTGVSKGYGFVTFESAEDVSKLLKQEGEHLLFKDRKLNIGPAVRKQQTSPPQFLESYPSGGTLLYTNNNPVAFPDVMSLVQGHESFSIPSLSKMGAASYPMMFGAQQFGAQQQFLMQPSYYQTTGVAASALHWAAAVGNSSTLPHWTTPQFHGSSLGTGNSLPVAAAAAVGGSQWSLPSSAGHSHYLYHMPTAFLPSQEMVYPRMTGFPYQEVDVADTIPVDASSNQASNLLMDNGGVSGQVQYIEVGPYPTATIVQGATASTETASISQNSMQNKSSTSGVEKTAIQNYGVKRVLAVPRQVVCAPSNSYGFYTVPPVKIIAGQGGQRIVAKSVGTTEIQILPKTQS